MGQQAQCRLRIDGRTSEGRALLETDDLLFRGGVRLKIPFVAIRRVDSDAGRLTVAFEGGTAVFEWVRTRIALPRNCVSPRACSTSSGSSRA